MKAIVTLVIMAAIACKREAQHSEHGAEEKAPHAEHGEKPEHEHHEQLPRKVALSEAVIRDAKIQVVPAQRAILAETLNLPGEIAADPDRLARIASPAQGRIEQVRIKEGARVAKGDVLVVVRVPEVGKVRATRAATEARATAARANAERLEQLLAKRLASEQEALDADAEADALEVEARSLGDQLGALGAGAGTFTIALRAPIAGTVIARDAVVGQPVSPEQTLGTIAALDQVWFLGRVFEKDLGHLRVGAGAEIHLNAYPDEHFPGTVEYLGQQVDPSARTVTARVRLENSAGQLRIGLFGTAQIELGEKGGGSGPRIVVPRSAMTEIAGKSVVFVREADGKFGLHEVVLGREAPGKVEVLAGLGEGEQVVTEGVFTLKSVVLKGSFAEQDHH